MPVAVDVEESLAGKFAALFPHLDERQRRLMMGAEARVLGHGGVAAVARAAGVSRVTVTGGVRELEAGDEPLGRTRRTGGGRKSVTKTDPGGSEALLALVEPESRGDPESPLRWTTKSLRRLAVRLAERGVECWVDSSLVHLRLVPRSGKDARRWTGAMVWELPRKRLRQLPVLVDFDGRGRFAGLCVFSSRPRTKRER